jgi:hypothetical protein
MEASETNFIIDKSMWIVDFPFSPQITKPFFGKWVDFQKLGTFVSDIR